jgi:hypothetical protein
VVTVSGRGSRRWATVTPVRGRHLLVPSSSDCCGWRPEASRYGGLTTEHSPHSQAARALTEAPRSSTGWLRSCAQVRRSSCSAATYDRVGRCMVTRSTHQATPLGWPPRPRLRAETRPLRTPRLPLLPVLADEVWPSAAGYGRPRIRCVRQGAGRIERKRKAGCQADAVHSVTAGAMTSCGSMSASETLRGVPPTDSPLPGLRSGRGPP